MYLSQINKYAMMINNLSDDSLQIHAFYGYLIGENINYDYIQEAESAFKEAAYLKISIPSQLRCAWSFWQAYWKPLY